MIPACQAPRVRCQQFPGGHPLCASQRVHPRTQWAEACWWETVPRQRPDRNTCYTCVIKAQRSASAPFLGLEMTPDKIWLLCFDKSHFNYHLDGYMHVQTCKHAIEGGASLFMVPSYPHRSTSQFFPPILKIRHGNLLLNLTLGRDHERICNCYKTTPCRHAKAMNHTKQVLFSGLPSGSHQKEGEAHP